jgi:hypothetical protein
VKNGAWFYSKTSFPPPTSALAVTTISFRRFFNFVILE